MNIFSVNQVNQVYVAKELKTMASGDTLKNTLTTEGDILVRATPDNSAIYFQHYGAGGITRSDLISVKNILWGKTTSADDMARPLKTATITLDSNINSGNPVSGQDYILRIEFDGYIGISPEDSKYWKYGLVHAYDNMTTSDFYKKMALSLAMNMKREAVKLISIWLGTTEVTADTKESDLTGTYTSVTIKEVEPDWILGTKQQKPLKFTVSTADIEFSVGAFYDSAAWGVVTYGTDGTIKNGKLMADYEYFHMGNRGDQYRMIGFPNYVPTKYLVDPTQEYDTIQLHYCFTDSNESVQKSEKNITLIIPKGDTDDFVTAINALITASGVTLNTL